MAEEISNAPVVSMVPSQSTYYGPYDHGITYEDKPLRETMEVLQQIAKSMLHKIPETKVNQLHVIT